MPLLTYITGDFVVFVWECALLVRSGLVRRTVIEPAIQIKIESSVIIGSEAGSRAVKAESLAAIQM